MINKKKIMQSVSLIVLTAVLYGNAYAPKKDMPQPDFKGFTKACATQEMIASSLHNADYITSTHPNTGFLDVDNEHEVSVEQNDTPVVTEAASSQAIKWSGPVLYANNYCQVYALGVVTIGIVFGIIVGNIVGKKTIDYNNKQKTVQ